MSDSDPLEPWLVAKFGGSSVASAARWQNIAHIVAERHRSGGRVAVVCSALAGVTDRLEALVDALDRGEDVTSHRQEICRVHDQLARDLGLDGPDVLGPLYHRLSDLTGQTDAAGTHPVPPGLRAEIIATGELMSTSLGARWLAARGLPVRWFDARSLLAVEATPSSPGDSQHYLSACCTYQPDPRLQSSLAAENVEILMTQGFLARDARGDTVLLGRGGSDTSAAYLAAKLSATRLEIWTDVPGLFTADPYRVPQARLIRRLSFAEASVMSARGARVLHPRCLEPVREAQIPLHIGWTRHPQVPGTVIDDRVLGEVGVKTVLTRKNLIVVIMSREASWQSVGFMADVSTRFQRHGLSIDLIASSPGEIRVSVDLAAFPQADATIAALLADLGQICRARVVRDAACVSVVGSSTRSALHRFAGSLERLGDPDVHLVSYAADDAHVSFVVSRALADELRCALHAELFDWIAEGPVFGPSFSALTGRGDGAARRGRRGGRSSAGVAAG